MSFYDLFMPTALSIFSSVYVWGGIKAFKDNKVPMLVVVYGPQSWRENINKLFNKNKTTVRIVGALYLVISLYGFYFAYKILVENL